MGAGLKISKLEETQIEALFTAAFYEIPRFQRPYMWTDDQLTDFWRDLVSEQAVDHFLGSMVTFTTAQKRRAIVDGQQRLTTITLLLCAVRNCFAQQGLTELSAKVHAFIERKDRDGRPDYVLRAESSSPFVEDHILSLTRPELKRHECDPGPEEAKLDHAFQFLLGKVSAEVDRQSSPKDVETALKRIRDKVLDLQVIHVGMEDEDEAYLVFETLNTRGMNLRTQDMVKNHVLKILKAKKARVDGARIRWTAAVEKLEKASTPISFDNFLLHQWLSTQDYTGKKQLYRQVRQQLTTKATVEHYLDMVCADVELYREMIETRYGDWPQRRRDVKRALNALRLFRVVQPLPFLLSVQRAREAEALTSKSQHKAFRAVEDFHFIVTAVMSRPSSGGTSSMYAKTGRQIFNARDASERATLIAQFASNLKRKLPAKHEFDPFFGGMKCSNRFPDDAPLVKYALRRILEVQGYGLPVDLELVTVEHIHPQGKANEEAGMTHEVIASLGNLLLVSPELNGKLADKSFREKKRILREANYPIDPVLAAARSWDSDKVQERTQWLVDNAWEKTFTVAS